MSEKATKHTAITAIKAVICSFFAQLSSLSGGGGTPCINRAKYLSSRVVELSISGINRSHMRNFFSWRDGFYRYLQMLKTHLRKQLIAI